MIMMTKGRLRCIKSSLRVPYPSRLMSKYCKELVAEVERLRGKLELIGQVDVSAGAVAVGQTDLSGIRLRSLKDGCELMQGIAREALEEPSAI